MLSLIVPSDDRDFNQNSVVGNGRLSCPGTVSTGLSTGQTTLPAARHSVKPSPNNNNNNNNNSPHDPPATELRPRTASEPPLDNRPPPPPQSSSGPEDLSSGDDNTGSSTAPAADGFPWRAPSPQLRPPGRRASSLAPHAARTGKLKRVSFGSSKGSMVETLIYDCEPPPPAVSAASPWDNTWQTAARGGRHNGCHVNVTSPTAPGGVTATTGPVGRAPPAARSTGIVARTNGTPARANGTPARANGIAIMRANGTPARANGTPARANGTPARPMLAPPRPVSIHLRPEETAPLKTTSRVRVTYYESKRPLSVSGSSSEGSELCDERTASRRAGDASPGHAVAGHAAGHTTVTAAVGEMPTTYIVSSVDAGWENPFRPGGELSKEADQIVRAIQSGRPLDSSIDSTDGPTTAAAVNGVNGGGDHSPQNGGGVTPNKNGHASPPAANGVPAAGEVMVQARAAPAVGSAPPVAGTTQLKAGSPQAGTVEVRRSVAAAPEGPAQVERVALKKKPRGKCCVVQ